MEDFEDFFSNLDEKDIIDTRGKKTEKQAQKESLNIEITDEMQECLDIMENTRHNLYLTGDAGTGKSSLIKYFISITKKRVVKLAPTGVAAVNIGGQTIHSFFKFPPKLLTANNIPSNFNDSALRMYSMVDTIIIDEISMVRSDMMDAIDLFFKINLHSSEPFGGKQIIMVGDLNQLPPVISSEAEREFFLDNYKSQFFFDARVFEKAPLNKKMLTKVFRQKDVDFLKTLTKIKNNTITSEEIDDINQRCLGAVDNPDVITLCTTNSLADHLNEYMLTKVSGEEFVLKGVVNGNFNTKSCPVNEEIRVRIGCKVMLLNNHKDGKWYNGTVGELMAVTDNNLLVMDSNGILLAVEKEEYASIKYAYSYTDKDIKEEVTGSFVQYPVRLAYAMTIHKAQGQTFEKVNIDLGSGTFAHGQLYVALSRCTKLEGIRLNRRIKPEDVIYHKRVLEFNNTITKDGNDDLPF